jgi:hypothetical protein
MSDLDKDGTIFVGKGSKPEVLTLAFANRHGLITGATGTGKTVTLQVLAEGLSRAGVSVFAADIKGDLSGIAEVGEAKEPLVARAKSLGFNYEPDQFPVVFWDLFGEQGHPVRATISEIGPLLLSRLMDLNDVQEGVLNVCFRVADEQGLAILDLKDLRAVLAHISDHASELTVHYGNVSKASIGTMQRQLLVLDNRSDRCTAFPRRGGGSPAFRRPCRGPERYRQRAREHIWHQSRTRNTAFDRAADRAGSGPFGQQPRCGPGCRRRRQVDRRQDGRLRRPRHRAGHHGRHLEAVTHFPVPSAGQHQ